VGRQRPDLPGTVGERHTGKDSSTHNLIGESEMILSAIDLRSRSLLQSPINYETETRFHQRDIYIYMGI